MHFKTIYKYKNLVGELVLRDLKTKYRRSILGFIWSILNPLMMMVILTFVFTNIFGYKDNTFPIYVLSGQIVFSFFSDSTNMAMSSVVDASALIRKVYIPKYILPISRVISSFINLIFSLIAVIIVMVVLKIHVTSAIIFFPIPLVYVFLFSIGISLMLSSIAVYFRDMIHLYGVLLTVLMYISAIFYKAEDMINKPFIGFFLKFNPVWRFIDMFRNTILFGKIPNIHDNFICIGFIVASILMGSIMFYKVQNKFILYI